MPARHRGAVIEQMFGFKKRSPERAFAIGKVPGHPEFLRAPGALGAALDAWLEAGWQNAHAARGADWEPAFVAGGVYGFLWSPGAKAEELACGIIAPSSDSVGRCYPLVIACPVPASLMVRRGPFVPGAAEAFFGDAHSLMVATEWGADVVDDLARGVADLEGPREDAYDAAEATHLTWCSDVDLEEGWTSVFGGSDALASASAALASLVDALAPCIRRERPTSSVLLRLPLGESGSRSATLWLDLVRRIGQWKQTVPSAFWAVEGGSMLLSVAPLGAISIRELWHPDVNDEHVFDVAAATLEPPSMSSAVARLIAERPGARMVELLRLFGS